jgi:hypothetical protein
MDFRSRANHLEALAKEITCDLGLYYDYDDMQNEFLNFPGSFNPDMKFEFPGLGQETYVGTMITNECSSSPPESAIRRLRFEDDLTISHIRSPVPEDSRAHSLPVFELGSTDDPVEMSRPLSAINEVTSPRDEKLSDTSSPKWAESISTQGFNESPRSYRSLSTSPAKPQQPAGTKNWLRRTGKQHQTAHLQNPEIAELEAHNRLCIVFASTDEPRSKCSSLVIAFFA